MCLSPTFFAELSSGKCLYTALFLHPLWVSVVPSELSQFWIFSCFINKLQRIAYVGRTEPGTNWNHCTEEKSTLQCHRWTLQASHATLDPIHSLVNKVIELLSLHVWLVMSTWLMAVLCTWAGRRVAAHCVSFVDVWRGRLFFSETMLHACFINFAAF